MVTPVIVVLDEARRRLVLELVGGFDDDEGWAGDQVMGLQ